MDIQNYWNAVLHQQEDALRSFFWEDARINWHNTNECFTLPEFIQANCSYPGTWEGTIEKVLELEDQIITVTHVYNREQTVSCHAVSFLHLQEDKILSLDEYWGDDGEPPLWRQQLNIGSPIPGR